ncbi:MAG: hypothetical protein LBJ72_05805, partial [Dysgonamonadaceae bacterium]|nr:hypothetical protein [Dysgonamonadaceae bacterium]
IGEDYVTEKFYEPLLTGSVPVYMGAPNIERFSPGKSSYIDVNDYSDPQKLAMKIKEYCNNDELHNKLLSWKKRPFQKDFIDLIETQKVHPFIRLAEKVKKIKF